MKRDVKHQNQQLSKAKQTRNQEEEKKKIQIENSCSLCKSIKGTLLKNPCAEQLRDVN